MALSVDVPDGMAEKIESVVDKGSYKNKSELIRDAIRRLLEERDKVEHKELSVEALKGLEKARDQEDTYTLEEARKELNK